MSVLRIKPEKSLLEKLLFFTGAVSVGSRMRTSERVRIASRNVDQLALSFTKRFKIGRVAPKATIASYNAAVESGKDGLGKPVDVTKGIWIAKPPFYASRVCPKIHHTMGGVLISEKGEVISMATHKPIPGLFAGGEVTGGVHGASRLGTVGIIDALIFGMVAGENI